MSSITKDISSYETNSAATKSAIFDGTGSGPTLLIIFVVVAAIGYFHNTLDINTVKSMAELRGLGASMPLLGAFLGYI